MDVYHANNLINMDRVNPSKTTFMSNHNNCCYNVIPFRLKKACATYQRLVDVVFSKKI